MFRLFVRSLHTTPSAWASSAEKSSLATLRKKTGYTFANCKKALELHNNDLVQAENWLREQAQSLGWSKATKLEGRSTKQGLVAVLVRQNIGALVEVNCETDFVARNENFREFVDAVAQSCVKHAAQLPANDALSKLDFDGDYLRGIPHSADGKSLSDHLALIIGKVGENASLRRATCFRVADSTRLTAFAHPPPKASVDAISSDVQVGRFGALVALQSAPAAELSFVATDAEASDLERNLCQHIVGMNPTRVGAVDVDKPAEVKDDEQCLIWQEYLLEPSMTVNEVLAENGLEIVQFKRFECGEQLESEKVPAADAAESATA